MYTVHDQLYVSINMEDVLVLIDPHCIGWSMNEYVQLVYVEILAYWSGLQCFRGAIITVQLQILISHFLFSLSRRLCSCHWNFRILVTDMVWELFKRWEDPKTTKLRHSPLISCNLLVECNIPIYNTKKESLRTLLDFFNESTPCEYVSTLKLSHTRRWWSYSTKPALCVRFSRRKVTLFEVPL